MAKAAPIILSHGQVLTGPQNAAELNLADWTPLARKYAGRYAWLLGYDDALATAFEGLTIARNKWDPHRGPFGAIAAWYVADALKAAAEAQLRHNGSPSHERPGGRRRLAEGIVPRKLEQRIAIVSGSTPVGEDGAGELFDLIADDGPSAEEELLARERWHFPRAALSVLDERQRRIILARYLTDSDDTPSLLDLAGEFDISAERVRQIELDALKKLRDELTGTSKVRVKSAATDAREMLLAGASDDAVRKALAAAYPDRTAKTIYNTLQSTKHALRRSGLLPPPAPTPRKPPGLREPRPFGPWAMIHERLAANVSREEILAALIEKFPARTPRELRRIINEVICRRRKALSGADNPPSSAPASEAPPAPQRRRPRYPLNKAAREVCARPADLLLSSKPAAETGETNMTRKVKKTTPAPKAKTAAKEKKPGIIATLIELMSAPKGATIDEMVAVLVKKFPDRSADGMRNTTRVQVARQGARVEKDEAGVRRYFLGKK